MSGREARVGGKEEAKAAKHAPKPTIGRIRRIFAAAGMAGALALAGCGGAKSTGAQNFVIDNSWGAGTEEPYREKKETAEEFWRNRIIEGGLDWVDRHFSAAIAHRIEMNGTKRARFNLGDFGVQFVPDFPCNRILTSVYIPQTSNEPSSHQRIQMLETSHSSRIGRDYFPPPQREESGQIHVFTETSQSIVLSPPGRNQSEPIPLAAFPVFGDKVYLAVSEFFYGSTGKVRVFILYDNSANLSILSIDYGDKGRQPKFYAETLRLGRDFIDLMLSESDKDFSKHILNTEYAISIEQSRERFGIFFAFSSGNPMNALFTFTLDKSEDGRLKGGNSAIHLTPLLSPDPGERLIGAASENSFSNAESLLEEGASPNHKGKGGATPLIIASEKGHLGMVRLLLNRGADPKIRDGFGNSALHSASARGHLEIAREILDAENSLLEARNFVGASPFAVAAVHGNVEVARFLASRGAQTKNKDAKGDALLPRVAAEGHMGMVKYLVEELGADLEATASNITPLMAATIAGQHQMARYLLEQGANPGAKASGGETALMAASHEGHLEVVKALVEKDSSLIEIKSKNGVTAFMLAVSMGKWNVAEYLLENGADVNAYDERDYTALCVVVSHDDETRTRHLLEKGADPNINDGIAMYTATIKGNPAILRLLVEHGGRLDFGGTSGQPNTLLSVAALLGKLEAAKYLVEEGGACPSTGMVGKGRLPLEKGVPTPLAAACSPIKPNLGMIEYLLSRGADVNMMDGKGDFPLGMAAATGSLATVKLLIAEKARINAKNKEGKTALELAEKKGHGEVAKFLRSAGAK